MKQVKTQRGAIGVIVVVLIAIGLVVAGVWAVGHFTKTHPETTEQIIPEQTATEGGKAIQDAKSLQNKYQNPTTQY